MHTPQKAPEAVATVYGAKTNEKQTSVYRAKELVKKIDQGIAIEIVHAIIGIVHAVGIIHAARIHGECGYTFPTHNYNPMKLYFFTVLHQGLPDFQQLVGASELSMPKLRPSTMRAYVDIVADWPNHIHVA